MLGVARHPGAAKQEQGGIPAHLLGGVTKTEQGVSVQERVLRCCGGGDAKRDSDDGKQPRGSSGN